MDQKEKEREENLRTLNELKTSINLVQFACHKYNYIPDWLHPDRKRGDTIKSSVNSIKLINKDNTMDCIIVAKNAESGAYVYKSLVNTYDRGTIYDFIKNRSTEFSIPKLRKICKNYLQGLEKGFYKDLGFDTRKVLSGAGSLEKPKAELFANYLKPLTQTDYLTKRGIDEEMQKKLFGNAYNHTFETEDNKKIVSVVVPFYNVSEAPDDNKKHLSIHTYQKYSDDAEIKKTFINGGRYNSVWINAGAFDTNKKITSLVVAESPLDSVSFAALHPKDSGENPILAACGGELGYGVPGTYQSIMKISGADKIILANDNDCKGQQCNAKILAHLDVHGLVEDDFLEKNKALLDTKVDAYVADYKGYLEWRFSHGQTLNEDKSNEVSVRDVMPKYVEVRDYYAELNKELKGVVDEKDVFKVECEFGKGTVSTIKVEFRNLKENWEEINESLRVLKFGYSDQIEIEKSICKDFNDDLKVVKGLDYKPIKENPELLNDFVKLKLISEEVKNNLIDKFSEQEIREKNRKI